jgi:hypothetical protein
MKRQLNQNFPINLIQKSFNCSFSQEKTLSCRNEEAQTLTLDDNDDFYTLDSGGSTEEEGLIRLAPNIQKTSELIRKSNHSYENLLYLQSLSSRNCPIFDPFSCFDQT